MILINDDRREDQPIDDATAWDYFNRLDKATEEERPAMAQALGRYAEAQTKKQAADTQTHFERLYTDPAYFDGLARDPVAVEAAKLSPFPKTANVIAANRAFLANERGVDPAGLGSTYEAWRDGYAQAHFNKPAVTDDEFFGLVSEQFKTQKLRREAVDQFQGDAVVNAFQDLSNGAVAPTSARVKEFLGRNTEAFKGVNEADALKQYSAIYDGIRSALEPHQAEAKQMLDLLSSYTGASADGKPPADDEQVKQFARGFIELPHDEREGIYQAVALAAKSMGAGDDKGFWQQLGESFGRGISDMTGKTGLAVQEIALRNARRFYADEGMQLVVDGEGKPIDSETSAGIVAGRIPMPSNGEWRMATDEEKIRLMAETDIALKQIEVVRELKNIADGAVDPIRPKSGGFLGKLEGGAYGAARSIPYTLTAAVPVVGPAVTGAAIFGGEYDRMRLEFPNLDPDAVAPMAAISAALQAPIEWVQSKALFGKLPVTGALLKRMGDVRLPLAARVGVAVGGNVLEQNAQEFAQDAIPVIIDTIGAAVREDMPEFDPEKAFRGFIGSRDETFFAVLPLALIGGGAATFREIKRGEVFTAQVDTLRMAGFSEATAGEIAAEPDPETRDSMIQENWEGRTDADIAEGAKMRRQAADKAREQQESTTTPTLESVILPGDPDEEGNPAREWIVKDAKGGEIYRTRDSEAAQVAFSEAKKNHLLKSTSGIAEAAGHIQAVNEAIGRGEDVQKLLTEQAPRSLLEEYNANPTPETLDRLFETVRFFGGEISEPAQLGEYFVRASNRGAIKDGIYQSIIRVHEGADGTEVMRDFAQDNVKRAVAEGDVSLEWVRSQLAGIAGTKGFETLRTESDTDVIESFSDVALAYFHGRIKDDAVPAGLRGFLRKMAVFVREIFVRSYRLKRAIAEGKVGENFQQLLATSVGLDADQIAGHEAEKAQRRMEREALSDLERGDGAQGGELLDVLKGAKLPDKGSPFFTEEIGRLKEAVREFNRGKTASEKIKLSDVFDKDATDPDLNIATFNENGFDFFTVDDLVQAVEERINTGKEAFGYLNNDAMQGGVNYSISGKQIEEKDYRGEHRAPGHDSGSPAHDLSETYPDDIYGPKAAQYYGHWGDARDGAAISVIHSLKGKPNATVKVYRAAPKYAENVDVEKVGKIKSELSSKYRLLQFSPHLRDDAGFMQQISALEEQLPEKNKYRINPGDWVTTVRSYAVEHGQAALGGSYDILAKTVKAKDIFTNGDSIFEFGYDPQSQGGSHYSIGKAGDDRVRKALEARLKRNPAERLALYQRAKAAFEQVREKRGTSDDPNKKFSSLLQSMGELNAILAVLPAEIRGKVGGMMPLANMGKDTVSGNRTATVDKFLEKRIEMVDRALEIALKKEYTGRIIKALQSSRPKKGESGVKKSSLGVEAQSFADKVLRISYLDGDATAERLSAIEATIDSGGSTPALLEEWGILNTFGDLAHRNSETLSGGLKWLKEVIGEGRAKRKIVEEERFARNRAMQAAIVERFGKVESPERFKSAQKDWLKNFMELGASYFNDHLSFEQFIKAVLPDMPEITGPLADRFRKADNAAQDAEIAARKGLMEVIRSASKEAGQSPGASLIELKKVQADVARVLVGRKVTPERLTIEQAEKVVRGEINPSKLSPDDIEALREELAALPADTQREYVTTQRVIFAGKKAPISMSKGQAIYVLLSWDQPDIQDKMRREGWLDETAQSLRELVNSDPVAKATSDFLRDFYSKGAAVVNPVYSRMFGMGIPQVRNYAPVRFVHSDDVKEIGPDGMPVSSSALPSFTKGRVTHSAPLAPVDALEVFSEHVANQAHWVNFAELARDFRALFANTNVQESLKAAHGDKIQAQLSQWTSLMEKRGGDKARDAAWLNQWLGAIVSGKAISALGFNLKSIAMQIDSAMRFALAIEPKQIISAFSDPAALVQSMPKVWFSPTVQRRIQGGMNPEQQFLFRRTAANPGIASNIAFASMQPLNFGDAVFTTIGSAAIYRSAYTEALASGANEAIAEARALDELDAAIYRFSQPTGFGSKSLVENRGGVLMRIYMMFLSDARLKTGVMIEAAKEIAAGRDVGRHIKNVVLIEAMALVSHMIASAYRDAFSDDDDEDIWSLGGWAKAAALAPFSGLFLGGAVAESLLSKLTKGRYFAPSRDPLLDVVGRGQRAIKGADKTFNFDDPAEMFRQWENMARAMALNPGMAAPAAMLNLIRPVVGAAENAKTQED